MLSTFFVQNEMMKKSTNVATLLLQDSKIKKRQRDL